MSKVDPRDFLLNTDYEQDKIVLYLEGSMQPGTTQDLVHNLNFTPLIFGVCAFNEDFSDSKSVPFRDKVTLTGTPPVESSGVAFNVSASTDSQKISLDYTNTDEPGQTLYFRLYAFEPSDSKANAPATSKHTKTFLLNTDYNYCKLYKKGVVDGNSDTVIEHDLGYIPQVIVWLDTGTLGKYITPVTISSLGDDVSGSVPIGIEVTENQIIFKYAANWLSNCKVHYRVYYDEA